ncbi:MAG: isoamylase early set domain-containing protein [Rhodothermales bacterium]
MVDKKVSPKGKTVKVIFELPAEVANEEVAVVGDFNGWDREKDKMKLDSKKGVWTKAISVKRDNTYQFRYYVDGREWRNDEQADGYVPNPYDSQNSVISV